MIARHGIVLIALLGFSQSAWGDAGEMARFEKEFPAAAKRQEERFAKAKGSCRLLSTDPKGSKPTKIDKAEFAIDHGYEKVTIHREFGVGKGKVAHTDIVYCISEETAFNLTRLPGEKNFVVEGIGSTPSDEAAYLTSFGRFVKAHHCVLGRSMTRVMASPGFRVTNAERVEKDGRSLVKVDYESGSSEPKERVSIVFDPQWDWAIKSMEYIPGKFPMFRITTEVEYGTPQGGLVLPLRVTIRDQPGSSSVCEFVDWSFEPTPEAEFMMPFYGLPDLASKASRSRGGMTYWLGGGALATLVAAIMFRRLSTRGVSLARS